MNRKYPRVEATHVAVRNAASIDDVVLDHLVSARARFLLVNPLRLVPMFAGDETEFDGPGNDIRDACLEIVREGFFVQEHPG